MKVRDDIEFADTLREYFSSLDQLLHPNSKNRRLCTITRFDRLLMVATQDFPNVTDDSIVIFRQSHQSKVIHGIDNLNKRHQIRNLPNTGRFRRDELDHIYDCYQKVLYY